MKKQKSVLEPPREILQIPVNNDDDKSKNEKENDKVFVFTRMIFCDLSYFADS